MNCIIVDDDEACRKALAHLAGQVEDLTVVATCASPVEAVNILRKENVDLLFLDIEMPEMSGLELLKALDIRPHVIFTTSHKEYALDAFELDVIDYLIKPVTLPRFLKAIAKVRDTSDAKDLVNTTQEYFFIKKDSVLNKVVVEDILWIEALGDYITVHTKNQRFIIHATLKSVEAKLPANKFVRVHRSFIIQIDNVKKVEDTTIYVNDTAIPVGALYKENFIKRLNPL